MAKKSKYREITDKYFQLNLKNKYIDLYHFSDYFNTSFLNTCQELEELKELVSSLDVHELISEEEYADAMERISFLEESAQTMARSLSNDSKEEKIADSGKDNTSGEEGRAAKEEEPSSTFSSIKNAYAQRYNEIQEASRSGLMPAFEVVKSLYTEKSKELEELRELRFSLVTDRFVPEGEYDLIYRRIDQLKSDVNFFARQIANEICKLSL